MWAIYRRRLPIIQALFLAICALLRWRYDRPWIVVGVVFAFLQLSALMGAWWGNRLARQASQSQDGA